MGPTAPGDAARIRRSEGVTTTRAVGYSLLLALLGVAEVAAAWVILRPSLPQNIPDHFGAGGDANGWVSAPVFLANGALLLAGLTGVFVALIVLTGRSRPLAHQFGSAFARPILIIEAATVSVSVPIVSIIVLVRAAGLWTETPGVLSLTLLLVGLIPLVAALLVVRPGLQRRWSADPPGIGIAAAPLPSPQPRARVRFGVGAPVEMRCSACAEPFELAAIPLFAPHMMFGGKGSLYVTCPRCGERSWDELIRRLPA